MANWVYNEREYTARNFEVVPEGDHRVRILDVAEKVYSTGNEGFQITLEVAGHNSRLWYNLILDTREPRKTNQRIGMFFDSFDIKNFDLNNYHQWIGRDGAVRVKHNSYNDRITPTVVFCLSRSQQGRLPKLEFSSTACQRTDYFSESAAPNPAATPVPRRNFNGFNDDFRF